MDIIKAPSKNVLTTGLVILTTYFSVLRPTLLNPIYNNIFNTIQKALKILYKYRIPLTYDTFL